MIGFGCQWFVVSTDMLRRTFPVRALSRTAPLLCSSGPVTTQFQRSQHQYEAAKGADVGARNESAYIPYEHYVPQTTVQQYGMPHAVNMLTMLPLELVAYFLTAVSLSIILWEIYARRHYDIAVLEAPKN
jgi:hypothetical protein